MSKSTSSPAPSSPTTTATDLPPPYDVGSPPPSLRAVSEHIHARLACLPSLLRSSEAAHASSQLALDLSTIQSLIPAIDELFSHLTQLPRAPAVAEVTLVPRAAVDESWVFAGHETEYQHDDAPVAGPQSDCSPTAVHRLRRIDGPQDPYSQGPDNTPVPSSLLFWDDWEHAQRLAHLMRQPDPPRPARQSAAAPPSPSPRTSEPKRKKWRLFGSSSSAPSAARQRAQSTLTTAVPTPPEQHHPSTGDDTAAAAMTVTPEEVTFRRQTKLGLWESMSGYALVVRIKIPGR
ncbi:hypothetical protein BROUX41_001107 [Berkeleyomyces rouxiae]|uniref:uncharacterized protein n=1 Tax=Berkeleyomyces rouxiae TaxID=2035830 RepID=UPI003B77C37D